MAITIAIVGRANVGKSTLFNHLTRSRDALVADQPGITRDRQYGVAGYHGRNLVLIDTGGLYEGNEDDQDIADQVGAHARQAVTEADRVFWLVDGRTGPTPTDERLAGELRPLGERLLLLVNKTEGLDPHQACAEFHRLGVGEPMAVSALRGTGIPALMERALADCALEDEVTDELPSGLRISVVGRPNVGKSTLINRLLGEERVLTNDRPGTTRDSIAIPFTRRGRDYVLIDTAGIRRRAKVSEAIEKFSIVKTLEAIDRARIVILVLDARTGVTEQDLSLLGLVNGLGKSLIIAMNKWDGLDADQKRAVRAQVDRKLDFVSFAGIHYLSALHGTGVGKLFDLADRIQASRSREWKPAQVTELLQRAVEAHPPPMIRGRRIKLRFAHFGGEDPVRIIIHGNQTGEVPDSYRRYLASFFRAGLRLMGTPVLVEFRQGENPYRHKRNELSDRQRAKRRRMIQHARRK